MQLKPIHLVGQIHIVCYNFRGRYKIVIFVWFKMQVFNKFWQVGIFGFFLDQIQKCQTMPIWLNFDTEFRPKTGID